MSDDTSPEFDRLRRLAIELVRSELAGDQVGGKAVGLALIAQTDAMYLAMHLARFAVQLLRAIERRTDVPAEQVLALLAEPEP